AYTANIANTINGGMVETKVSFNKNEDHYIVNVRVPGIERDTLKVEINNDLVLVFLQLESGSEEPFNYLLKYFKIPFEVDAEQIWADYEAPQLHIVMPFKELKDGYWRSVEINS
ncbi:MAG: Hsp20/alpha crystallin family protein, partial [Bacteroidota bacterium]